MKQPCAPRDRAAAALRSLPLRRTSRRRRSRADLANDPAARRDARVAAARGAAGRLERRAPGQRLPRRRAAEDRREAAARADRLPAAFEFTAGTQGRRLDDQSRSATRSSVRRHSGQARALSFSDNGDISGPVVFAGYGIVVPDSQDFGYDSYATLDVKDKIVLVLRYFPEDADQKTRGILARYSDLRYKAMAARQRGAKAMLVVTGPRSPNAGELVPMTFDTAIAGSGIVAASVTGDVADAIFKAAPDKTLTRRRRRSTTPTRTSPGFALPGLTADSARRRRAREAHRPQRRRLSASDDAGRRPARSRGSRSARTTITSAAAKPAIRSPAKKTPGRCIPARTTMRRASAAVLAIAASARDSSRASRNCWSASGPARSSA